MARLNLEDQFFLDCMGFAAAVGDQDRAIGQAVRFFRIAQEKHKHGKVVSEEEFSRGGFHEALIGTFAERVSGGIQAIGAKKHFGWLADRVNAGKKGGSKRKQTKAKRSKVKQPEASPSPSPSYSSSHSCSNSSSSVVPILSDAAPAENPVQVYCDLWKAKNGKSPTIRPKEAGQLTNLAKDVGISRAKEIMRTYFAMPDPFFMKRGYDVGTLLANLSAISQFEAHGKIVTSEVVKQIEKQVDKAQGTDKRPRRPLEDILAEEEAERALLAGGSSAS